MLKSIPLYPIKIHSHIHSPKTNKKMKKVFLAFAVAFAGLAVNAQGTAAKQESKPAAAKTETKTTKTTEAKPASTTTTTTSTKKETTPAATKTTKTTTTKTEAKPAVKAAAAPAKEAPKK
jgi:hypothetical protein